MTFSGNSATSQSRVLVDNYNYRSSCCSCCFPNRNGQIEDEQTRLGSEKALITLIKMSVGPIVSNIVTALYGIVDSFWVSKAIGQKGLTAMGAVSIMESIVHSFGLYISVCVSSRISFLFGQQRKEECSQVFVDILRVSVILSILVPIITIPCTRPLMKWFGAEESIQDLCVQYMIPLSGLTIIYQFFQAFCGLMQAEGRSWIMATCQITTLILNMAFWDPALLIVAKTSIWGASLGSILASSFPLFFLFLLTFQGRFQVKPNFGMFLKGFSPETWKALRVGLPSFVQCLSMNLPDVVIQKVLGNASNAIGQYDQALSAWNILLRAKIFIHSVNVAVCQGLMPCASFSFGANRMARLRSLSLYAFGIGFAWCSICEAIVIPCGETFAKIYGNDPIYLGFAKVFFARGHYLVCLSVIDFLSVSVLQAVQKVPLSLILSIVTMLLPHPCFALLLHYTGKTDPARIIWTFTCSDGFAFVVCMIVDFISLSFLRTAIDKYPAQNLFGREAIKKEEEEKSLKGVVNESLVVNSEI